METIVANNPPTKADIKHAVTLLANGEVVALPTETVYGLCANAEDEKAVSKIFSIKGRPRNHPLIIHIDCPEKIEYWADISQKIILSRLEKLVAKFNPAPLTFILPRKLLRGKTASAGQNTIAIRIPDNKIFLEIAKNFSGLAAPSANPFGRISPTTAKHVYTDLQGKIPFIIDGGSCAVGVESTIINLTNTLMIMRPGKISAQELSSCLGEKVLTSFSTITDKHLQNNLPIVSGSMLSHYAPLKPLLLINNLNKLNFDINKNAHKFAILAFTKTLQKINNKVNKFIAAENVDQYAFELFNNLRDMDNSQAVILIVIIPEKLINSDNWQAVIDRLQKASFKGNINLINTHE